MMREMRYKDVEKVNNLLRDSFGDLYEEKNIDVARRVKYMKMGYIFEKILSSLFKDYEKSLDFFVCEEDGKIVGATRIAVHTEGVFTYTTMAIDKDYRRKGIAYELAYYAEEIMRERGAKYIAFAVKTDNLPSIGLSTKRGFTIYNEYFAYMLKKPLKYEDKKVEMFRKVRGTGYAEIEEIEKKVMNELTLEIEGTIRKPSFLNKMANIFRKIIFREKFYEYVLERDRIVAYSRVSHFVDGSSLMIVLSFCEEQILRDFLEKILYKNAREKMRAVLVKEQTTDRKVLQELGFEEYSRHYMFYKKVG